MKRIQSCHLVYLLAGGGILFAALNFSGQFNHFAALNFNSQPLFSSLDQFVLVALDKIHLAENVQVSSGDIATNKEISITEKKHH